MNNYKVLLSALLITFSVSNATALYAATNNSAVAADNASTDGTVNGQNRSVEDLVAIAKAAENNEALNDTVLGNEAINESILGNDAINPNASNPSNSTTNNQPSTVPVVKSSAASVDADKLILNNPVVDQANILNPQEKQRLEAQLRGIYQQGLAQAAVVIVPTTNGLPIFDYSLQAAEKWQLGESDTDDGLLILVAVNDRDIYIQSGYGLEGVLPDAVLNRIIRENITPYFKQEAYADGLISGIDQIEQRLKADPEILAQADAQAAERSQSQNDIGDSSSPIFLFFMAMVFGSFITSIFGRIFGSILTAGGFFVGSLALGGGFFMTVIMAVFLWLFLVSRGSGGGRGGRGGRGGGMIFMPGLGGGSSGGGGFGSGGFGGGGGGFGGGGAGGSW